MKRCLVCKKELPPDPKNRTKYCQEPKTKNNGKMSECQYKVAKYVKKNEIPERFVCKEKPKNPTEALRTCLGHICRGEKKFVSSGPHNRICKYCLSLEPGAIVKYKNIGLNRNYPRSYYEI